MGKSLGTRQKLNFRIEPSQRSQKPRTPPAATDTPPAPPITRKKTPAPPQKD